MKPAVIDISHHNTVISWEALKLAGIQGVIHKASQGTRYGDPEYAKRRMEATKRGILWGAYHFATNADPTTQVDWFLKHAAPDATTLLALDWENNPDGPDMSVEQARMFLAVLMRRTGREPKDIVIYGGNVLKEKICSDEDIAFFSRFPLWLCQYGPAAKLPKAWKQFWLWQYSEHGKLDGMAPDGHVDLNVFGGADIGAEWAPATEATAVAAAPAVSVRADPPPQEAAVAAAKPIAAMEVVKVAYGSRSIWAALAGIFWMVAGVITDWAHTAWDWIVWALQIVPQVQQEVEGVVSPLQEMASWFKLSLTNITLSISAVCCLVFLGRHLLLRLQAQQQSQEAK